MSKGQILQTDDQTKINQLFSEGDTVQIYLDTSVAVNDFVALLANGTRRPLSPVNGQATLVGGSVTVANTDIKADSNIVATALGAGTGIISIDNIVAGVSFDIISSLGSDTRDVSFMFVR